MVPNCILGFLFLVFSSSLLSQETQPEIPVVSEQDVVVSATKSKKRLSDTTLKTEPIRSQDLTLKGDQQASQAIERLTGISVRKNHGKEGQTALIQGLSGKHVLVLVDGAPVPQSAENGVDLSAISTQDIERIEVIKGGASSLYGGNAMGGVINISTKKPTDKPHFQVQLERRFYHQMKTVDDNYSPSTAGVSFSQKQNKIGQKLFLSRFYRGRYDLDTNTIAEDGSGEERYTGNGLISRDFTNYWVGEIGASFKKEKLHSVDSDLVPLSSDYERLHNRADNQAQGVTIQVSQEKAKSNFNAKVNYLRQKDQLKMRDRESTSFADEESLAKQSKFQNEIVWSKAMNDVHRPLIGASSSYETLDQGNISRDFKGNPTTEKEIDHKYQSSVAVFVQNEMDWNRWSVVPGLRLSREDKLSSYLSPRLSTLYRISNQGSRKINLRSNLSTGHRAPTLRERFYFLDHSGLNYKVEGNPSLAPEKAVNIQLGGEVIFNASSFNLNLFQNQVKNLISTQKTTNNSGQDIYRYQNFSQIEIRGVEIEGRFPFSKKWDFSSSYTYSETVDTKNNTILPFRPLHSAKMGLTFRASDHFVAQADANYQGDEFIDQENLQISPDYTILDFSLTYLFSKEQKIQLKLDNLLHEVRTPKQDGELLPTDSRQSFGSSIALNYMLEGAF